VPDSQSTHDRSWDARGEVDPDLCVALGAAIQGGAIAGAEVSAVLVDVTPYTFGTSALGELNGELYPYQYVPIIAKNTAIPVHKSEVFFTIRDDQSTVEVRVYQGENADALENIQIGEFHVEGLSKAPAGNPIILDLALDRDGILHVSAKEKNTGLERRITIDRAMSRYGSAIAVSRPNRSAVFRASMSPRPHFCRPCAGLTSNATP
jgi:molecular chaperone DnaK (HSP70)